MVQHVFIKSVTEKLLSEILTEYSQCVMYRADCTYLVCCSARCKITDTTLRCSNRTVWVIKHFEHIVPRCTNVS